MKHYTRNTVSAERWCGKCKRMTQHEVHGVKGGACIECIAKLEAQHEAKKDEPKAAQQEGFKF